MVIKKTIEFSIPRLNLNLISVKILWTTLPLYLRQSILYAIILSIRRLIEIIIAYLNFIYNDLGLGIRKK